MDPTEIIEDLLSQLKGAGASMRCAELTALLESVGFEVKSGKAKGHKLYFHDGLDNFMSSSYNCDHGKNPEIKRPYINNVMRVIQQHKAELIKYLANK